MDRREFLIGLTATFASSPSICVAQRPRGMPRLIVMSAGDSMEQMRRGGFGYWEVFYDELERLGFYEGVNLEILRITGHGRPGDFDQIAAEVIDLRPDVVFGGGSRGMRALQAAGATMPVVGITGDPLRNGFVEDIARPEANFTGFSVDPGSDFFGKHVQLVRDLFPDARRLAFVNARAFLEPPNPTTKAVQAAVQRLGFVLVEVALDRPIDTAEYEHAFATIASEGVEVAYFSAAADNRAHSSTIARMALEARLPTVTTHREIPDRGGLISYGLNRNETYLRAAGYVARVLNGEMIANLPYQQPDVFDFIINLRTARALGIEIPPKLLIQATEIIE